jgi:hypothetical protein
LRAQIAVAGQKIESGLDLDNSGTLDAGEVTSTTYVCDGADGQPGADGSDGLASLVAVTKVPAGATCFAGGQRIMTGIDANDNGEIDDDEVSSTGYVCSAGPLLAELTPPSGTLVETDAPGYSEKGYSFIPRVNFTISGGAWFFTLPAGGITRMKIYNSVGIVVAQSADVAGDGTERWYDAELNYTFFANQSYTVSFYTNRAGSARFDRKDMASETGDYEALLKNVTSRSNGPWGDDGPEAYPTDQNWWAPFQRLTVVK